MTMSPRELGSITAHADYAMAAPTPEHLMPPYYLAGLCDVAAAPARAFTPGGAMSQG